MENFFCENFDFSYSLYEKQTNASWGYGLRTETNYNAKCKMVPSSQDDQKILFMMYMA